MKNLMYLSLLLIFIAGACTTSMHTGGNYGYDDLYYIPSDNEESVEYADNTGSSSDAGDYETPEYSGDDTEDSYEADTSYVEDGTLYEVDTVYYDGEEYPAGEYESLSSNGAGITNNYYYMDDGYNMSYAHRLRTFHDSYYYDPYYYSYRPYFSWSVGYGYYGWNFGWSYNWHSPYYSWHYPYYTWSYPHYYNPYYSAYWNGYWNGYYSGDPYYYGGDDNDDSGVYYGHRGSTGGNGSANTSGNRGDDNEISTPVINSGNAASLDSRENNSGEASKADIPARSSSGKAEVSREGSGVNDGSITEGKADNSSREAGKKEVKLPDIPNASDAASRTPGKKETSTKEVSRSSSSASATREAGKKESSVKTTAPDKKPRYYNRPDNDQTNRYNKTDVKDYTQKKRIVVKKYRSNTGSNSDINKRSSNNRYTAPNRSNSSRNQNYTNSRSNNRIRYNPPSRNTYNRSNSGSYNRSNSSSTQHRSSSSSYNRSNSSNSSSSGSFNRSSGGSRSSGSSSGSRSSGSSRSSGGRR